MKNALQRPDVTVDVVLLTLHQGSLCVALSHRDREPEAGRLALPGGYVHPQEDNSLADAALRVLRQKTGIKPPYLEQLHTFSGPLRDPRGWSLSVAHFAVVPDSILLASGHQSIELVPASDVPPLPFDHNQIIETAVSRLRTKTNYSSLAAHLLPGDFTISDLHSVYQAVLAEQLNLIAFRRKVLELGFLEPVKGSFKQDGRMRPAQLYRLRMEFRRALHLSERTLSDRNAVSR